MKLILKVAETIDEINIIESKIESLESELRETGKSYDLFSYASIAEKHIKLMELKSVLESKYNQYRT